MKAIIKSLLLIIFFNLNTTSYVLAQIKIAVIAGNPKETRNLIGFNTGFNHRHWVVTEQKEGVKVYTNKLRDDFVEKFTKIHSPVLRFPGGVIANFYHLYPPGYNCSISDVCPDKFSKGYGLRKYETNTHNGMSVKNEERFEANSKVKLTENWVVTFADLIERYQKITGDTVEIVLMMNVLSHFRFGNHKEQFSGNVPNLNSSDFQNQLIENLHVLKYLTEIRQLKVIGVELGTELYFPHWISTNNVNVDRFISLIKVYRDLFDNNGFKEMKIGVPINKDNDISANGDNWTRKIADKNYNPNQVYDGWIIHEYQKLVPFCPNSNFFNCKKCDWKDKECGLYPNNTNRLNCDPKKHSPFSADLEEVFNLKVKRFAPVFNGELAENYYQYFLRLKELSGLSDGKIWYTEWNQLADGGVDKWKCANKFYANSLLHGINIFEILLSFYQKNSETGNFMEIANLHSFASKNIFYPVLYIQNDKIDINSTYYPNVFLSEIKENELKKVDLIYTKNTPLNTEITLSAFVKSDLGNKKSVYLFYTNKTNKEYFAELDHNITNSEFVDGQINYVEAEALHSASEGNYPFKKDNITVSNIDNAKMVEINDFTFYLPALSYGLIKLEYKITSNTNEFYNDFALDLYPNPAKNELNFSIKNNEDLTHKFLVIYNCFGEKVIDFPCSQKGKIDIKNLKSGIYFIALFDENHTRLTQIRKFVH